MRTLLIHQIFLTGAQGGGTRHYELGKYVANQGHDFCVVASDVSYLDGKKIETTGEEENVDGIRVFRARMLSTLHRSFVWRVFAFLSFMWTAFFKGMKVRDVDVVMGTSPPLFQAVSAWMIACVRRKPFLLEIRDLWPDFAIDMKVLTNPVLIWLARRLERFLYNRADRLLVNSPAYRDHLIAQGINPRKINLIPNGVDPSMFDPQDRAMQTRQALGLDDSFIVTYAGALGQANDLPTIVRAAERLKEYPRVHFLLIGDGKERANTEKLIAEKNLSNITLLGLKPKSQMKQYLAATDVCLATLLNIPMFTMPYPNKVFDYMAAGRPTILGIDGVIREVMESSGGGVFVPPGDDAALADAVRELEADPSRARAMGLAARVYVSEHFNRAQHAQIFLSLLLQIVRR